MPKYFNQKRAYLFSDAEKIEVGSSAEKKNVLSEQRHCDKFPKSASTDKVAAFVRKQFIIIISNVLYWSVSVLIFKALEKGILGICIK